MAVKKVAVTLPEELYDMVERARAIEHRSRSEFIQEAIRSHFGGPVYVPSEQERQMLERAVDAGRIRPGETRSWQDVRDELQSRE